MANNTIQSYTAALTIDAANDFFLMYQNSTTSYKSINRNTIMGVSGTPADISTAQILTNKTIGITNTITQKDGSFTIQNTADTSKQGLFSLANVTTATTRTYTLPNASVTLASLTGTETLTNKTITAPAITGGTIDNSTITVDSISGHTTSTIVTVGGVQMNNGLIATAGSITNNGSIATGAIIPNSLVASSGTGWSFTSFTPTWTGLNFGSGGSFANTGLYVQIGKTVFVRTVGVFGTSGTTFPTNAFMNLPVTPATYASTNTHNIGNCWFTVAGANYIGVVALGSTSVTTAQPITITGTLGAVGGLTTSAPATWAAGNSITMSFWYEAL